MIAYQLSESLVVCWRRRFEIVFFSTAFGGATAVFNSAINYVEQNMFGRGGLRFRLVGGLCRAQRLGKVATGRLTCSWCGHCVLVLVLAVSLHE